MNERISHSFPGRILAVLKMLCFYKNNHTMISYKTLYLLSLSILASLRAVPSVSRVFAIRNNSKYLFVWVCFFPLTV